MRDFDWLARERTRDAFLTKPTLLSCFSFDNEKYKEKGNDSQTER